MSKKQIVLSAASVACAVQAVASLQADGRTINVPHSDGYGLAVKAATSGALAQSLIRSAMPEIASSIRIDNKMLSERYAVANTESAVRARDFIARLESARDSAIDVAQQVGDASDPWVDSTQGPATYTCYANCHSACHGSRSWR